jgi:pentatricopeptide repeat protein
MLIDGCARVGYTKMAFNLFTRMRQRELRITGELHVPCFKK